MLSRIISPAMLERLCRDVSHKKRRFRDVLFIIALVFLFIALARPQWGNRVVDMPTRSRDLVFVIDCSKSMLASDVSPSRLEHAKWFAEQLLEKFPGDRFGIITFAGDAFPECPLTDDKTTLLSFLSVIDTDSIPVEGSDIEKGLQTARQTLSEETGGKRAIVLLTDGDELQGEMLQELTALQEAGVPVITVGIGKAEEGTPVRTTDGEYLRDRQGEIVTTRLYKQGLQRLATGTGGVFIESTTRKTGIKTAVKRLKQIIPEEDEEQEKMLPIERFQLPLAIAVFFLVVRLLTGERKIINRKQAALLVTTLLFLPATTQALKESTAKPDGDYPNSQSENKADITRSQQQLQGHLSVPKKDIEESKKKLAEYKERLKNSVEDFPMRLLFNIGNIYQHLGQTEKAEQYYRQVTEADSKKDGTLAAAWAYWNLGTLKHGAAINYLQNSKAKKALSSVNEAGFLYNEAMRSLAVTEKMQADDRNELIRKLAINKEQAQELKNKTREFIRISEFIDMLHQRARQQTMEAAAQQQYVPWQKQYTDFYGQLMHAFKETRRSEYLIQRLRAVVTLLNQRIGQTEPDLIERLDAAYVEISGAREKQEKLVNRDIPRDRLAGTLHKIDEHLAATIELLSPEEETQGDKTEESGKKEQGDGKKTAEGEKADRQNGEKDRSRRTQEDEEEQQQGRDADRGNDGREQDTETSGAESEDSADTDSPQTRKQSPQRLQEEQAEILLEKMTDYEDDFQKFMKQRRFKGKDEKPEKNW